MKLAVVVVASVVVLSILPEFVSAAPVGTATECCCGDTLAEGPCCELTKYTDNVCSVYGGDGVDCKLADLGIVGGDSESCPSTAFNCPETIQCPPTTAPTPTPAPTLDMPPADASCGYIEGVNGPIESEETCETACQAYGLFCSPEGNISLCGSTYYEGTDCRGKPHVECTCGSAFSSKSSITLCKDKEISPPRCDNVPSLPYFVNSDQACIDACQFFDSYCVQGAYGTTKCGTTYTEVTEGSGSSSSTTFIPTCFCGPEGNQQQLCGAYCNYSSAASAPHYVFFYKNTILIWALPSSALLFLF